MVSAMELIGHQMYSNCIFIFILYIVHCIASSVNQGVDDSLMISLADHGNSPAILHQNNIEVFKKGNYLIAIEPPRSNIPQDDAQHIQSSRQLKRKKRSSSYDKYLTKLKGSSYSTELKRTNSVHWFPEERAAVIDLLVVVDYSAYAHVLIENNYNAEKTTKYLEDYYRLLVTLMDARYEAIDDKHLRIKVRPASVIVQQDRRMSEWVEEVARDWRNEQGQWERVVDPKLLLDSFSVWLKHNWRHLPKHDHAIAFIGYRMVREGRLSPSSGMAYVNTICQTEQGFSCSVIQETWGFGNAGAAAHELAHSLGATHDGLEENKDCPASHGYIMAPTSSPQESLELNFFSFSPCSIEAIKKTLSSSKAECLYDSTAEKDIDLAALSGVRPGEWITPDQQCAQVFGDDSGQCRMRNLQEPEEVCQRLWCSRPLVDGRMSCASKGGLHAVYGTPCGRNKICYNGRCVNEESLYEKLNTQVVNDATENLQHLRDGQHNQHFEEDLRNLEHSRENEFRNQGHQPHLRDREHGTETSTESSLPWYLQSDISSEQGKGLLERLWQLYERNNQRHNKGHQRSRQNHQPVDIQSTTTPTTTPTTPTTTTTTTSTTTQRTTTEPSTTTTTTTALPETTRTQRRTTSSASRQIEITNRPLACVEDKDPRYCRSMVYSHPHACKHANIREYCCFSCGFYSY